MPTNPNAEPASPARAWRVVGLLFFAGGLCYLDRSLLSVMRLSVMEKIPMTDEQFGLLLSIYAWVTALLSPFCGFLSDRFKRSRVIILSLFLWSSATALTALATTFGQLLASRIALALAEACYLPASLALITDWHRGRTRSLATGVHIIGLNLGAALSGTGGVLAQRFSWEMPYRLFGLIGIALSGVILLLLRDSPGGCAETVPMTPPRFGNALASLFAHRSFLLVFAYFGLAAFATGGLIGWMPTFLKERFHLSQGAAGLSATGYINLAGVVGLFLGGIWADRRSRSHRRGRILVAGIGVGLSAPCILLVADGSVLFCALLGLALFGFCHMAGSVNTMPILCQVTDRRYRSTAYGVLNLFAGTMSGAATYVCGALRTAGVDLGWYLHFAAVTLLVCSFLLFRVRPLPNSEN